jgi:glycopeptide antibiotics resistance protein
MVDVTNVNAARFAIGLSTIFLFGSIWCGIVVFLRTKKKKSLVYLVIFSLFYSYLYKVLDYTLIQLQSLLLLKHFLPSLTLNGVTAEDSFNVIPLITLTIGDSRTSLLNILLMLPLGFGLPFITKVGVKQVVGIGALFSIAIELLQLITGLTAQVTFRIADINDVIFNTVGVAIGYALFIGFARIYGRTSREWQISGHPSFPDRVGNRARP